MKNVLKLSAFAAALLFVAAQFVRPSRVNPPFVAARSIEGHVSVSAPVAEVLGRSCADCHTNRTRWPWYSNVAPASWFVVDHVNHGRRHLNFSEWAAYDRREAEGLLEAICLTAKGGSMPLDSYTLLHRRAKLSPADVRTLCDWATAERHRLASSRM